MMVAVDVDYRASIAIVAGVIFDNWLDNKPVREITAQICEVKEYISGQFYQRELPCILELLQQINELPECIIIDGYVYLNPEKRPGLGKHLYDALQGKVAVIGVAKKPFKDMPPEIEIYRGKSKRPLYVTATGISAEVAKQHIAEMDGNNRLPTLLKRVDQLCRSTKL
jgi:deoxyribonuclease V